MKKLTLIVLLTTFMAQASITRTAHAVTAWWAERRMVVEADDAVTPFMIAGESSKQLESTSSRANARALRVGATPLDGVLEAEKEEWYILSTEDGPGYIRIGATGSIMTSTEPEVPGNDFMGGFTADYESPGGGATLLEVSQTVITGRAVNGKVKRSFMKIGTKSKVPVSYRISFVKELPETRVGCLTPQIAASQYIEALGRRSSLSELYRATRKKFTVDEAEVLRENLFRTKKPLNLSIQEHHKDPNFDPNRMEMSSIQDIIIADFVSENDWRAWAFVVKSEERNGLWIVTNAERDPELTDEDLAKIIRRDNERFAIPLGAAKAGTLGNVGVQGSGYTLLHRLPER